jgi:hypothetical protein
MKERLFFCVIFLMGFFFFGDEVFASGPTIINSDITTPTTWTKSNSPYIVLNSINIASPLTIEPGTIVKLKNDSKSLLVTSTLTAVGTESEKIVFTSVCDSNYGGNTKDYGFFNCYNGAVRGQWGYISIYNTANTVKIKNAKIFYAGRGLSYHMPYDNSVVYQGLVSIENTEIRYSSTGIYIRNGIPLMKSLTLSDNNIGLGVETYLLNRIPKISNSSILNNGIGIRATSGYVWKQDPSVEASYNWWGDASGPYYENPDLQKANLQGKGNRIIGREITFRPWLGSEPIFDDVSCIENCYSNVMFLPGLEASRLYAGTDKLWEPYGDSDVEKLYLNENGKSIRNDIVTRDVIDNAYLPIEGNIYKSFLEDLNQWKNMDKIINDYAVIPYDWRLSLDDTLTGTNVIQELRRIADTSKSKKVTIVAHSNGGLLAKALTDKLGAEAGNLIDKIVFVAVPQSGTPQAIGAILHGYDQGLPVNWMPFAMSPKMARMLAHNMPSAYNLLPSRAYFSNVTTPVITFDDGEATNSFIGKYGEKIDNFSELDSFLKDDNGKVEADSSDLESPSEVNKDLLLNGENVHNNLLDNWSPPAGVSVYQIAGFGEETAGTIKYWTGAECLHEGGAICSSRVPKLEYTPELVVDGDGTVVAPSALAMGDSENVKKYWVDLKKYDTFFNLERKHADILEVSQLRDFIKDNILTQSIVTLPNFLSASKPFISSEKRLRYYLHSPLALSARDSAGNEISASVSDIPGARYGRFGEVQYISLPVSSHPTVILDGEAEGSFTLEVQETEGNAVMAETTFAGIPNTSDTKVTMDFPDGSIENASPLKIDYDGNGENDFTLKPKAGGVVIFDTIAPTTAFSPSGTQGKNNWYTSDVIVALSAEDNKDGSGFDKTQYSLDDGKTWKEYDEPFTISQEGMTTIKYFSTDNQGNEEETKTETIKIDKTAPEMSFFFDSNEKRLIIVGNDVLSSAETSISGTSVTVTDEAGHTTVAVFAEDEAGKQIKFEMKSLAYDGVTVLLPPITLNYEWSLEKTGDVKMLNELAVVGDLQISAHYLAKNNATIIEKTENSVTTSETKPGLVVLQLVTDNGNIKINY